MHVGVWVKGTELAEKRLGLLQDVVPGATTIALLLNSTGAEAFLNAREAEAAARAIGKTVVTFNASQPRAALAMGSLCQP